MMQEQRAVANAARARAIAEERRARAMEEPARKELNATREDDDASASTQSSESIAASIRAVLQAQKEAWNAGDIDQFMEYYWKSDALTFSSGGKTTRGWQGTLKNYKKRYPTRDEMGKLDFNGLEVINLGDDAALVLGQWRLARKSDKLEGNFSLVFRRIDRNWIIIHDHTSCLNRKTLQINPNDSPWVWERETTGV